MNSDVLNLNRIANALERIAGVLERLEDNE